MLLTGCFDDRGEMNQLVTLLAVHEICLALCPSVLEFNQYFYELYIILKLGIHNFDVLFILLEE